MPSQNIGHPTPFIHSNRLILLILQIILSLLIYCITQRNDVLLIILAFYIICEFTCASYFLDHYQHHARQFLQYSQCYRAESQPNTHQTHPLKTFVSMSEISDGNVMMNSKNQDLLNSGHSLESMGNPNEAIQQEQEQMMRECDSRTLSRSQRMLQEEYHKQVIEEIIKYEVVIFHDEY